VPYSGNEFSRTAWAAAAAGSSSNAATQHDGRHRDRDQRQRESGQRRQPQGYRAGPGPAQAQELEQDPTFVLDQANVPLAPQAQADVREPISSSCTANPFNQDGVSCQGGALGTPFFLSTNAISGRLALFGNAYQGGAPTTGGASTVAAGSATVSGSVNPEGGPVTVQFQFGTSTAYDQTTSPQAIAPANRDPVLGHAQRSGPGFDHPLPRGRQHRFGSLFGADETASASTAAPPPGNPGNPTNPTTPTKPPKIQLKIAKESLGKLLRTGKLGVTATLDETAKLTLNGFVKLKVRRHGKARVKLIRVFTSTTVSLGGHGSKTVELALSRKGRKTLAPLRKATLVIIGTAPTAGGTPATKEVSLTLKR
jgi:hypothetical protein